MNHEELALIKNLSPEKRALLFASLKQEAVRTKESPIVRRQLQHEPIPLSLPQQRLWALDRLQPGNFAYNEITALRLAGVLDIQVLEQSLNEIIRRHEDLRTTFPMIDGNPVQVIAAEQTAKLSMVDLSKRPEAEQQAEVQRLANDEARRPFDLSQGPLLRVALVKVGEKQNILLVAAHHIVLDGWSIGIFTSELAELYKAFSAGKPSPLPELPIQYADFAIWQHQWLRKEYLDAQLNYWTQQLRDLPPVLNLTVVNPRPEVETFQGARQYFNLGTHHSKQLREISSRENASLFMALLAIFQILLHRYSGQTDIPVGAPIANRNHEEIEQLIGFFVNTLVFRGDLSGNPNFLQLLRRVRDLAIAAFEHQEIPFEQVVEALHPERSLSHHPLFQVVFTLQNTHKQPAELPGLTITSMELDSVTAKFDLLLSMEDTPQGLQGYWEYNTDLFEQDTIRRMSGHFQTLLQAVVSDPEQVITQLPLLNAAERNQMLVEWNRTQVDYPHDKCIHELFEAQVAKTSQATAVAYKDERLSYEELNGRANRVARKLRQMGVGPEVVVGIYMSRSTEMMAGVIGVLKAGGAYLPLDATYPRERVMYMMEDAGAGVVVTQKEKEREVEGGRAEVLCIEDVWEGEGDQREGNQEEGHQEEGEQSEGEVEKRARGENLAYVIYTSGSTGKPKGVMVSHRNLVHSTTARWEYYRQPVTSFLLLSSLSFDSSVVGIFWTLTQGGCLVLPGDTSPTDILELCHLIESRRVSHLLSIPSLYDLILDEARPQQIASLETVIMAGEMCSTKVIEHHRRLLKNAGIFNEYGPTEAAVWSTVYECASKQHKTKIPIGKPISNAKVFIFDANLQPVPIGVPGQLHIGGAGVARGYLNQPQLTAEKFIPHSLCDTPDARLYKTGDVARYLPDGNIDLLGRVDDQVKIRGYRVELGEIEAAVFQYSAVRETVVILLGDEAQTMRMVAYVVVSQGQALSVHELRAFLQERLPGHAVPSDFVILDKLPRLPNGKVDRQKLHASDILRREMESTAGDNWTDLQRSLANIWQETLGIEKVGLNDNFFQVGGNSLSIIRVHNRLREITGKDVSITDLFKHPTISSFAEFLGSGSVLGEI
jgi:amino acid adenylation domain-containing protein